MRMSLLVVRTIVISYLAFDMYYFVSDTISISIQLLCQYHLFFSLNLPILSIIFCCICITKIHCNTYSISKYIFFTLANVLIDAFINIIQLIFVLYCYTKSIEVCILFFNIFFFFCYKRTNLHIQIVSNVLLYIYTKVFNYKIRLQYLFFYLPERSFH